jgi:hypothetical protein
MNEPPAAMQSTAVSIAQVPIEKQHAPEFVQRPGAQVPPTNEPPAAAQSVVFTTVQVPSVKQHAPMTGVGHGFGVQLPPT